MILVVIFIAIMSVGLSFWSLRTLNRQHEVKAVKENLATGRVVYHAPHKAVYDSLSSEDSSLR